MIAMNDDFKNSIKAKNRNLKGYVEILYDYQNIEGDISPITYNANQQAPISNGDEMINGVRVETNFASLENNYFRLDGSFTLPNNPNDYTNTVVGFITDDVVEDLFENKCYVRILNVENNDNLHSITIYTKDNIPATVNLYIRYGTDSTLELEQANNTGEVISFDFANENISSINYIDVTLEDFEYQDRRVRINEIEFGVTNIYKDNDLMNFEVDDEISKFVENTPANNCTVVLANYDNKFDPINPQGMTKYLNENVQVIPHIGIVTQESGIEYVNMGTYYLDNWKNNSDKTTTFNCLNAFKFIGNQNIQDNNGTLLGNFLSSTAFNNYFNNTYNYTLETNTDSISSILFGGVDDLSLLKLLQNYAIYSLGTLRMSRDNKINIKKIPTTASDTITLNEMKERPYFENTDTIGKASIGIQLYSSSGVPEDNEIIFSDTFSLPASTTYKIYKVDTVQFQSFAGSDAVSLSCTGATATLVSISNFLICVRFTGTAGANVSFNVKCPPTQSNNATTRILTLGSKNEDAVVENTNGGNKEIKIDNYLILTHYPLSFLPAQQRIGEIATHIFNNDTKYKINFEYFGNPMHEAGDVVSIETDYGFRDIFIEKLKLTFDGSLSGTIEGVGN